MEVIAQGGLGSGKTAAIVYSGWMAALGQPDMLLRKYNRDEQGRPERFATISNLCVRWEPTANRQDGNMNPLDLVGMVNTGQVRPFTSMIFQEFHRYMDSRLTAVLPKNSKIRRLFLDQLFDESRKRSFNFFLDTQNRYKLDNRIRDYADYLIFCHNYNPDKRSHHPSLRYIVVQDPDAWHDPNDRSWFWTLYPSQTWVETVGSMYVSEEIPSGRTEAGEVLAEARVEEEQVREAMRLLKGEQLEPEETSRGEVKVMARKRR